MDAHEIKTKSEKLLADVTAAGNSDGYKNFMRFSAKFHTYSLNNTMLIWLQRPDATMIAGYTAWLKMNRHVMKGEHGITIFAPCPVKPKPSDDPDEAKIYFKPAYVFDISQTEGDPIPEPPQWKTSEKNAELNANLLEFARSKNIEVEICDLPGDTQGRSLNGKIQLIPTAGTSVIIHEIAHELLHWQGNKTPKAEREQTAESIAYLVSCHFKLDTTASANYIACWQGDAKSIKSQMAIIQKTASEIITAIQTPQEKTE